MTSYVQNVLTSSITTTGDLTCLLMFSKRESAFLIDDKRSDSVNIYTHDDIHQKQTNIYKLTVGAVLLLQELDFLLKTQLLETVLGLHSALALEPVLLIRG